MNIDINASIVLIHIIINDKLWNSKLLFLLMCYEMNWII